MGKGLSSERFWVSPLLHRAQPVEAGRTWASDTTPLPELCPQARQPLTAGPGRGVVLAQSTAPRRGPGAGG